MGPNKTTAGIIAGPRGKQQQGKPALVQQAAAAGRGQGHQELEGTAARPRRAPRQPVRFKDFQPGTLPSCGHTPAQAPLPEDPTESAAAAAAGNGAAEVAELAQPPARPRRLPLSYAPRAEQARQDGLTGRPACGADRQQRGLGGSLTEGPTDGGKAGSEVSYSQRPSRSLASIMSTLQHVHEALVTP
jgi:hypothetical protein